MDERIELLLSKYVRKTLVIKNVYCLMLFLHALTVFEIDIIALAIFYDTLPRERQANYRRKMSSSQTYPQTYASLPVKGGATTPSTKDALRPRRMRIIETIKVFNELARGAKFRQ